MFKILPNKYLPIHFFFYQRLFTRKVDVQTTNCDGQGLVNKRKLQAIKSASIFVVAMLPLPTITQLLLVELKKIYVFKSSIHVQRGSILLIMNQLKYHFQKFRNDLN